MGRKSADRTAPADTRELSPVDGLAQLSFVVHRMLEHRAAEHDLSIIQTRLLGVLRDRKPTINELGKLLGLDKSSTSGLVERAERRGLVARSPSPPTALRAGQPHRRRSVTGLGCVVPVHGRRLRAP